MTDRRDFIKLAGAAAATIATGAQANPPTTKFGETSIRLRAAMPARVLTVDLDDAQEWTLRVFPMLRRPGDNVREYTVLFPAGVKPPGFFGWSEYPEGLTPNVFIRSKWIQSEFADCMRIRTLFDDRLELLIVTGFPMDFDRSRRLQRINVTNSSWRSGSS